MCPTAVWPVLQEMKETLAESMMTGRHLLDNVPAGLGANDRGAHQIGTGCLNVRV